LVDVFAACLAKLMNIAGKIGLFFVLTWVKTREQTEGALARFASLAVSDLFGTEVGVDAFNKVGPREGRDAIGKLLGNQILRAITGTYDDHPGGPIEPSEVPAEVFVSKMADLAVEGWFESFLMETLSVHYLEKAGDLKDVIARVFGFGRLSRRVLGPYVSELIEKPTQLVLNKKYRPTVLSQGQLIKKYWNGKISREILTEKLARLGFADDVQQDLIDEDLPVLTPAQLVHQFNRGLIERPALDAKLNARGYPNDVIEALTVEGRKYIGTSDIAFLVRNKYWTLDEAVVEYRRQGYSDELARQSLNIDRLQRIDTAKQAVVASARALYLSGDMDADQYRSFQERAGMEPEVIDLNMLSAGITLEGERKKISEGDAETAVIRGFWTMIEYDTFLRSLHYNEDDILTKTLLITDKIQLDAEAKRKRELAENQRATLRAVRLQAALDRQAQLEALRLHPVLSLAQVAAATVRGFMTLDQYRSYLRLQHYSEDDVAILSGMVSSDRADFLTTQARRQKADAKLATTSLTTAELERGVIVGALTMDDFRNTLANELVDAADIDVLVKSLQATLDSTAAALSRRGTIQAGLASQGVSIAQMERAVRLGLRTLTEYRARLAQLNYSDVDQELLSGLLANQMQKDQDAEAKRLAAEAAAAVKKIPLSDLRAAVKAGLRPIADYQQALIDLKYVPSDVDTMVELLRSTIAGNADAAARQAALEVAAANMPVPLTVAEQAVALGVSDVAILDRVITDAGGAPEDVDVITASALSWAADLVTARQLDSDATQQLERIGKSLPTLKRGLRAGTLTETGYTSALAEVGFGADSIKLMVDLVTTENEFLKYAMGRRQVLDATGAPIELARSQQEQHVRASVTPIADYIAWLSANGYSAFDQATLSWLLSMELT